MTYEIVYNTGIGLGSDKAMMYEAFRLLEEYKDIQDVLFMNADLHLPEEFSYDTNIGAVGVQNLYHHPKWGYMIGSSEYTIVNDIQDLIEWEKGIASDEEVKEELTKLNKMNVLIIYYTEVV